MTDTTQPREQASERILFEAWKGYPLPEFNDEGRFDWDWLHREFVAFKAGLARAASPVAAPEAPTSEQMAILVANEDGIELGIERRADGKWQFCVTTCDGQRPRLNTVATTASASQDQAAAQLDAGNLPPLPRPAFLGAGIYGYLHADMERYANQYVAPYAERIRQMKAACDAAVSLAGDTINARNAEVAEQGERIRLLTEALELSKKKLGLALKCDREKAERLQDLAKERAAPAWAAFADNGNVIIWSRKRSEVDAVAVKYGRPVEPILAHIDGRTAGTASEAARLDWIIGNPNANIIFTATGWTIFDIVTGQTFAAKQPSARAAIDEARAAAPSTQEGAKCSGQS